MGLLSKIPLLFAIQQFGTCERKIQGFWTKLWTSIDRYWSTQPCIHPATNINQYFTPYACLVLPVSDDIPKCKVTVCTILDTLCLYLFQHPCSCQLCTPVLMRYHTPTSFRPKNIGIKPIHNLLGVISFSHYMLM